MKKTLPQKNNSIAKKEHPTWNLKDFYQSIDAKNQFRLGILLIS